MEAVTATWKTTVGYVDTQHAPRGTFSPHSLSHFSSLLQTPHFTHCTVPPFNSASIRVFPSPRSTPTTTWTSSRRKPHPKVHPLSPSFSFQNFPHCFYKCMSLFVCLHLSGVASMTSVILNFLLSSFCSFNRLLFH